MIGLTSATEMGKKAYLDGVDFFNWPSYLNPQEQDAWVTGYNESMHLDSLMLDDDVLFMEELYVEDSDEE